MFSHTKIQPMMMTVLATHNKLGEAQDMWITEVADWESK